MSKIPSITDPKFVEFLAFFKAWFAGLEDATFDNISDEQFLIYYLQASAIFKACCVAFVYLVAHNIFIDIIQPPADQKYSLGSGEMSQSSVGQVSISLQTQTQGGNDVYFTHSSYGVKYLLFRDSCKDYIISPRVYPTSLALLQLR